MSVFPRRIPLPPNVSDQDVAYWMRKVTETLSSRQGAFGEMYYPFAESVLTISAVDTSYTTYTSFLKADEDLNVSSDTVNSYFSVGQPGMYEISFDVSCSGPNNTEFDFELHRNDSEISHGVRLNIQTAGDIRSGHINARQRLDVGDLISVHVKSDSGVGADLGTYNSSFGLTKIGV